MQVPFKNKNKISSYRPKLKEFITTAVDESPKAEEK